MAKKQKKKATVFETVQFQDFKKAKREVSLAKVNQIRILIGFVIACFATYFTINGFKNGDASWVVGLFLCLFSYLIGGGIFKAIKFAWKLTVFGWFLIPFFPIDLAICFCFFFASLYALVFAPVIFVGLNFIQHKKTLDAAQRYLAECSRNRRIKRKRMQL